MSGGQAITSGQGSVTGSLSVPLVGIAIATAQGAVDPGGTPVSVAMTGSAATSAAGTPVTAMLVPLRSRKVGGGSASRALVGQAVSVGQGAVGFAKSFALSGQAILAGQGSLLKGQSALLTGILNLVGQGSVAFSSQADPTWVGLIPSIVAPPNGFIQGAGQQSYDMRQHTLSFNPALHAFQLLTGAWEPGVTLNPSFGPVYDGVGPLGSASNLSLRIVDLLTPAADWAARISGPSVLWYHSFDTVTEVNQFRWTNNYSGGNDPLSKGVDATLVTWQSSGGADGGPFLRCTYPVGSSHGGSYWARPFMVLNAAGSGRGTADPGASGSVATQPWNVTDGSTTLLGTIANATNPAFYGPAGRQALFPTKFQGTDYFLQVRVRRAQTPGPTPDAPPFTSINGKLVWFTTTSASFSNGEIVTYGQSATNPDVVGTQSFHNAYSFSPDIPGGSPNFNNIADKSGGTVLINNVTNRWRYTGGWDTLLYHITPGELNGTGNQRTHFEVWAQRDLTLFPGEAGQYTKIWDVFIPALYETGTENIFGGQYAGGWNCLILAIYHNGSTFNTSTFNFDYDQVIFSKATIPAPNF